MIIGEKNYIIIFPLRGSNLFVFLASNHFSALSTSAIAAIYLVLSQSAIQTHYYLSTELLNVRAETAAIASLT